MTIDFNKLATPEGDPDDHPRSEGTIIAHIGRFLDSIENLKRFEYEFFTDFLLAVREGWLNYLDGIKRTDSTNALWEADYIPMLRDGKGDGKVQGFEFALVPALFPPGMIETPGWKEWSSAQNNFLLLSGAPLKVVPFKEESVAKVFIDWAEKRIAEEPGLIELPLFYHLSAILTMVQHPVHGKFNLVDITTENEAFCATLLDDNRTALSITILFDQFRKATQKINEDLHQEGTSLDEVMKELGKESGDA